MFSPQWLKSSSQLEQVGVHCISTVIDELAVKLAISLFAQSQGMIVIKTRKTPSNMPLFFLDLLLNLLAPAEVQCLNCVFGVRGFINGVMIKK